MFLADQFISCGKSSDMAQELASQIWLAVLDSLEENERTFCLLKCLAQEGDVSCTFHTVVFLPPDNYNQQSHSRDTGRFMSTYI